MPDDLVTVFTAVRNDPVSIRPVVSNVRVISVGSRSSADEHADEGGLSSTILGLDVTAAQAKSIYQARVKGDLMVAVQGDPPIRNSEN